RRGSFTDSREDREGLLAEADKDTLFLDEIGDISKDLQRLLIKALEEKQYLRLGDTRPRKSDFRLLTATNLSPTALRQKLDADFLDRIGLLRLRLPPLREVPEELPWIWDEAYKVATRRSGASPGQARLGVEHHARVLKVLQQHPLPGNLRDLFGIAYRLIAARCDAFEPLSPQDAVAYALEEFEAGQGSNEETALLREVAQAFALSQPLDGVLRPGGMPLSTRKLKKDLMTFVSQEVRRLSSERHVPIRQLCDVTDRTLREHKPEGRKKPSERAEE
ncbi:MAG TPA: sigma 54-interacting transcriptional regulator, partial [Archangium sp.]|nr:sigma 54-interacting transcriptional regulator [Archangium sp.]